jgi:hypothetical protein
VNALASLGLAGVREKFVGANGAAHVSDRDLDRWAQGHDTWPGALRAPGETCWRPDIAAVWQGCTDDAVAVVPIAAAAGLPILPVEIGAEA